MDDLHVNARVTIAAHELAWIAVRASGPGGQNVNKVSSKVELRWDVPGSSAISGAAKARLRAQQRNRLDADGRLLVTSQKTRDQHRNLEDALAKLAEMVREALIVPKTRRPTKPTRGSKERRIKAKKARAEIKRGRGGHFE